MTEWSDRKGSEKMKKSRVFLAGLLAVSTIFAAVPVQAAEEFNLGVVCPLSGSSAVSGAILNNAVKMAVDEINEAGGINGEIPINLISADDEAVPATSVTAVQKLVEQDKVNACLLYTSPSPRDTR